MSNQNQTQKDDALFEQLGKSRKKKKRRILLTVIIIAAVLVIAAVIAVVVLQDQVRSRFGSTGPEVLAYTAETGTLHTVVSGSGSLTEVDLQTVSVPDGVEINEVSVKRGNTVKAGDILATVDMSSVMKALANVQSQIDALDEQISEAEGDSVSSTIKAGVKGRVKYIFAESGTDVTACMASNGALAILSLDGYMAVDITTDALSAGDSVTVTLADGSTVTGTVEKAGSGTATVLVTDNGPGYNEAVTVTSGDAGELGTGSLYIHSPLKITGYAGTVKTVHVTENKKVSTGTKLFTLKDTSYSTNYENLLRQRQEQEEILAELLTIYQDGAVLASQDGTVRSVLYSSSASTDIVTLSPDTAMEVTITVSESDILSLEVGQVAEITVSSVGDTLYTGYVTEIDDAGTTSSGVTQYSAIIQLDKAEGMLAGMTADVDIRIAGVENAVLVPVEAVHQTSAIAFVYTSYDEQTQQYGGMVEVTTGLWGSSYVEITSGLQEGDTVYYAVEETSAFAGFGNIGGMGGFGGTGSDSGFGGGNMPDNRDNSGSGGNTPDMGGERPNSRGDSGFGGGNMPGGN